MRKQNKGNKTKIGRGWVTNWMGTGCAGTEVQETDCNDKTAWEESTVVNSTYIPQLYNTNINNVEY